MKKAFISVLLGGSTFALGLFLVGHALVFAAAGTPPVPGNLITNAQMQSASTSPNSPDNWTTGGYGSTTITYNYPLPGPQPGDVAAKVTLSNYVNGAGEWFFQNVPVVGKNVYQFADSYNSDIESNIIAQWTLSNGSFAYDAIATLPPTNGAWANTPQEVFPAPANAVSVTVLHLITNTNGTLETTNYALTNYVPTGQGAFSKAMVSLTFDDGYTSQFFNANPILSAAGIPGTYYIITDPILEATANPSVNMFIGSGISTSTVTSTSTVKWGDITNSGTAGAIYTDPTYQIYTFTDTYTSTASSSITVDYCSVATVGNCAPGNVLAMNIGSVPAGNNLQTDISFTLPTIGGNTVTPISIIQSLNQSGSITVSNPSLVEYQTYMTESELQTLQAEGNEIDSHTKTHPDLSLITLTTASSTDEILGSRTALLSFGMTPADGFAYPFGNYNTSVKQMVGSSGYDNARTVDVGFNSTSSDPLLLKSESVTASTTLDTVESWIDTAVANKWWLVITLHDVDPADIIAKNGETYAVTPAMLQSIVSYLKSAKQSGSLNVTTMDQGLAVLNNSTPPPPPPVPTIAITPTTLPNGTVGTSYSQTLSASTTATGPFTWSVSSGSLPQGLILNASSTTISGTPTTAGTSTFNIFVTNGTASTTKTYSIGINSAPVIGTPITITPTTLPNGTVGTSYSQTLTASTTASGPFTWTVSSGTLPQGLTFDASSTAITGTPTTAGSSNFNVTVTNGTASTTQPYSLTIDAAPVQSSGGGGGGGGGSGAAVYYSGGGGGGGSYSSSVSTTTSTTTPTVVIIGSSTQSTTTPTTTPPVLSLFRFTHYLYYGLHHPDVMELQKRLMSEGFFNGPITGYFGPLTRASVMAYQRSHHISVVGSVGPLTRGSLNESFGG